MTKPSLPDCDCPVVTWILGTNDAPLVSPVPAHMMARLTTPATGIILSPVSPPRHRNAMRSVRAMLQKCVLQSLHLEK